MSTRDCYGLLEGSPGAEFEGGFAFAKVRGDGVCGWEFFGADVRHRACCLCWTSRWLLDPLRRRPWRWGVGWSGRGTII